MRGIQIPIGTNLSQLDRGLAQARGRFNQFGNQVQARMSRIGAGIAGALVGAFSIRALSQMATEFDELAKQAARLDIAPSIFQKLSIAAKMAGSDAETLARALIGANQRLRETGSTGERSAEALGRLGIAAQDFLAATPDRQVALLADGFSRATDRGQATADLLQVLGTRAQQLIPLFRKSGEEITNQLDSVRTLSDQQFESIEKMSDQFTLMGHNIKAAFADQAMPAVTGFGRYLSEMIDHSIEGFGALANAAAYALNLSARPIVGRLGPAPEMELPGLAAIQNQRAAQEEFAATVAENIRTAATAIPLGEMIAHFGRQVGAPNLQQSIAPRPPASDPLPEDRTAPLDALRNAITSLGRVGGGVALGSAADPSISLQRRSVTRLESIDRNIARLVAARAPVLTLA